MKKELNFRKRFYCSVVAILSLFAAGSNSLHAVNSSGSGSVLASASVSSVSQQSVQILKAGTQAPVFTLTSSDGKTISLSEELKGYVIVLNLWSSVSAESNAVNDEIAKLAETLKNSDIAFLSVSMDENSTEWQAILQKDGQTLRMAVIKGSTNLATQYGVSASSLGVYVINYDGKIMSFANNSAQLLQNLKGMFGM
ncbi:MAG: TlpA family protein disulfide reductase [Tannerella sp.]|jgi:peroxiredoxin|nr:TlpA family protein disulfide reductase [Tannerella sp.]